MKRLVLFAAFALLALLAPALPVHPADSARADLHPGIIVTPVANAQLTSTAIEPLKRTVTFKQNNSGTYGGSSTIGTFPTNFSSAPYSSISSFTESFTETSSNGMYPQTNFTQGTAVLANATISLPFTLAPTLSATPVKQRVVELYSPVGALPGSPGTYTVTTVASQAIVFSLTNSINWTANLTTFTAGYTLAAPKGYWLNQSQVFIPFPSIANVNYSTVRVYVNGTLNRSFQVQTGGVYENWVSLGPGYNATITVQFQNLPTNTGAAPVLYSSKYAILNLSADQLNVTWSNLLGNAYAGVYLIQANYSGQINPTSLIVQNGARTLPVGDYFLEANTLTILPGVVTVPVGGVVTFYVTFSFLSAPPAFIVNAATVCIAAYGVPLTCSVLAATGALLMPVALVVGWLVNPSTAPRSGDLGNFVRSSLRNKPAFTIAVLTAFLVFIAIYLLLQVL